MPKLRADLLRHLTLNDQELLKILRKQPLKAYKLEELLPQKPSPLDQTIMEFRLKSLKIRGLVTDLMDADGAIYWAKAKGHPPKI
jgi:hypothetical protein